MEKKTIKQLEREEKEAWKALEACDKAWKVCKKAWEACDKSLGGGMEAWE